VLWRILAVPVLLDDGAGAGVVMVTGVEVRGRAGGVRGGLLRRRLAVRGVYSAGVGAAVLFELQEERVRVLSDRLQASARVGRASVVPAEAQVRRKLATGGFAPLARVADDA
jgi:hypothetical protein